MDYVPDELKKALVQDEIIDNHFVLREHELFSITQVFTTKHRMFIKNHSGVKDIDFSHISSLELFEKKHWAMFVIGIILIVGTIYAQQIENPPTWATRFVFGRLMYDYGSFNGWFYYILGAVLIIIGLVWTVPSIKFGVSGLSQEQVISGQKDRINRLFKVINERRFKQNTENE